MDFSQCAFGSLDDADAVFDVIFALVKAIQLVPHGFGYGKTGCIIAALLIL